MKVTLQVSGRRMTFSEEELAAIVEEHFSKKATSKVTTTNVAKKPTEGNWFEVKPLEINQTLFKEERNDELQEQMRQLILEAFEELKNNLEKYGRNFKTMMPEKTWKQKKVEALKKIACEFGGHMANWVEQALEWAQRIANGENWADICNKPDTANWYRAVIWKNGCIRAVGGSVHSRECYSASNVSQYNYYDYYSICHAVPLIASYEK